MGDLIIKTVSITIISICGIIWLVLLISDLVLLISDIRKDRKFFKQIKNEIQKDIKENKNDS